MSACAHSLITMSTCAHNLRTCIGSQGFAWAQWCGGYLMTVYICFYIYRPQIPKFIAYAFKLVLIYPDDAIHEYLKPHELASLSPYPDSVH